VQFLTRIPVALTFVASDKQLGQSVLYYPLVGLLIGFLLVAGSFLLVTVPVSLQAAIILTVWVLLTGGLHLDGLADCADAWVGGLGDRQRTLNIMKDPSAGSVAVIILVLLLLLKWNALQFVLIAQHWQGLLITPVLGRTALLILMLTTPYIRKKGIGEKLIENMPLAPTKVLIFAVLLFILLTNGFLPLLLAGLVIIWVRYMAILRLRGVTGDIYGATVELVEMTVLLGLAIDE